MRENRDRARQTKFNGKELCRATPVATGTMKLARCPTEARQRLRLGEFVHLHKSIDALHHPMDQCQWVFSRMRWRSGQRVPDKGGRTFLY
jgi:hypothetical protein